jgi:hypothetical protein
VLLVCGPNGVGRWRRVFSGGPVCIVCARVGRNCRACHRGRVADRAWLVVCPHTPDALLIEITATGADVTTYEDVVGHHLVRFGERDELQVQWARSNGAPGTAQC